jgi:hypothetical protein
VAVRASKMAWAAKQSSQDAGEGMNKMVDSISSMTSLDEDAEVYRDPSDPTKVSCRAAGAQGVVVTGGQCVLAGGSGGT